MRARGEKSSWLRADLSFGCHLYLWRNKINEPLSLLSQVEVEIRVERIYSCVASFPLNYRH